MRSPYHAGAALALVVATGCGRPPAPAAPPSGQGWRILAEGIQEATVRSVSTGRGGQTVVLSGARLNDSKKEERMTEEDAARQLTVGRNVSEFPFRAKGASEKP